MKNALLFISLFCLAWLSQSCKKKLKFMDCKGAYVQDSAEFSRKLVGSWKQTKEVYYWYPGVREARNDVRVVFTEDSFTVIENSILISQGNWKLTTSYSYYELQSDSILFYIHGDVSMCNDKLCFSTLNSDGMAFEFVRQK